MRSGLIFGSRLVEELPSKQCCAVVWFGFLVIFKGCQRGVEANKGGKHWVGRHRTDGERVLNVLVEAHGPEADHMGCIVAPPHGTRQRKVEPRGYIAPQVGMDGHKLLVGTVCAHADAAVVVKVPAEGAQGAAWVWGF